MNKVDILSNRNNSEAELMVGEDAIEYYDHSLAPSSRSGSPSRPYTSSMATYDTDNILGGNHAITDAHSLLSGKLYII